MRKLLCGLMVLSLSFDSYAAGFPWFKSEVPGVQLWEFVMNENGFPEEAFTEDPENEFVRYCDGHRRIYVNSRRQPILCKLLSKDGDLRIQLMSRDETLVGLAVVSKRPLKSKASSLQMDAAEIKAVDAILKTRQKASAKEAFDTFRAIFPGSNATSYDAMIRQIKSEPAFLKYGLKKYKVAGKDSHFFIANLAVVPDTLGWDLSHAVLTVRNGALVHIGDISGCIEGFRDIDGDGNPEVLTTLCENAEGLSQQYWTLYPTVREVVHRSQ